jgi:hypothetical protein
MMIFINMNATQIDRISAKILNEGPIFGGQTLTGKQLVAQEKEQGERYWKSLSPQERAYKEQQKKAFEQNVQWLSDHKHDILFAGSILALLVPIPGVNVALSAALSGADAALYWSEGDRYSAMTMAAFMLMPGMGKIVQRIPGIRQIGSKGMRILFRKVIQAKQGVKVIFSNVEKGILKLLPKNQKLIQSQFAKNASNIAKKVAKSKPVKKVGRGVLKAPIGAAKVGAQFKAADMVQQVVINPVYSALGLDQKDLENGNKSDLDALVALNNKMK